MLNEKEINKIEQLIKQGKSNYRIWKETGYSPNTVKPIREKMEKTKQQQIPGEDALVKNPIETVQKIISDIDMLIQTKLLDKKEEKKWRKRVDELREIQRVEIEDRISKEREDAGLQIDEQWKKHIEQNYVEKDVVTGLEGEIQVRNTSITHLKDKNTEKDKVHEQDQTTIMNFSYTQQNIGYQIQNLTNTNTFLNNNYWQLQYYYENRFNIEVGQGQEQLKLEWEVFSAEKTRFLEYKKDQLLDLDNLNTGVEMRRMAVETRENKVAEREEEIEKQENELEASKNRWNTKYSEFITSIKTRVDNIAYDYCDELVKRCFEKQITEIDQQQKEIKDQKEQFIKEREILNKTAEEQRIGRERLQKTQILLEKTQEKQKCTIVHPEPCSGAPIVQSGSSP